MNRFSDSFAAQVDQPARYSLRSLFLSLIGVMAIAFCIVGWWSSHNNGAVGWQAAGLAASVCFAGAAGALLLAGAVRAPKSSVGVLLLGMLIRMGVPLVAAMMLINRGGVLVEAGIVGMIVCFYLIALAAETCLSLKLVQVRGSMKEA